MIKLFVVTLVSLAHLQEINYLLCQAPREFTRKQNEAFFLRIRQTKSGPKVVAYERIGDNGLLHELSSQSRKDTKRSSPTKPLAIQIKNKKATKKSGFLL